MQQDLEDRFLSSIHTQEDLAEAVLAGVTPETLIMRKEILEHIITYQLENKDLPPRGLTEIEFTDFKFIPNVRSEEGKALSKKLIKAERRRQVVRIIDESARIINDDVDKGVEFITSKISKLQKPHSLSKSFTDRESLKRLDALKERRRLLQENGIIGMKTGLSFIDDKLLGWQRGNLIGIIARLGIGKSTLAHYLGGYAYTDGNRVALLSPEMTVLENELKFDTTVGALLGYKFPTSKLIRGEVDEKEYEEYLTKIAGRKDWLTMESVHQKSFTTSSIQAIVEEFSPDLTIVDGFRLLDIGEKTPQNMERAAYELKSIAVNYNTVMLVTSQANRNAADEVPEIDQIYGTDAFAHACDVLIMMGDSLEKAKSRWLSIAKKRMDEGTNKKVLIKFDIDIANIG